MKRTTNLSANQAFQKWVDSLPPGRRNGRLEMVAEAVGRSHKHTVRPWYFATRPIPREHARILNKITCGMVSGENWPEDKVIKNSSPANRAFRSWARQLPWGERSEHFIEIADALGRSGNTVRAWYSCVRPIPGLHAIALEKLTHSAVGRQHWPEMWPEIAAGHNIQIKVRETIQ